MTIKSPVKLFALGFGAIFALTQVGLVGMIARKSAEESRFPPHFLLTSIHHTELKVMQMVHTIWHIEINDPLVMSNVKDIEKRGGFLGNEEGKHTDNRNVYNGWSNSSWWIELVALVLG